jgi:arylsulfatase A-like enzyme
VLTVAVLVPDCLAGAGKKPDPKRPNVVIILTDDQGYGDLGCHGNRVIKTPNLDRLFKQSVRLTDFHVDPTCSPTRSALLTGRYSSRTGVWHTVMGRSLLRTDEVTLADIFLAHGYRTGLFGKWHLGDNYPYRPQDRGFQEVLTFGGGGIGNTPDFWGNNYFNDTLRHNGKLHKAKGYCTDVFFAAALQFIERSRDGPFLAYITPNAPHAPFNVAPKYSKPYVDQGVPGPRAQFYGMITNIDENVGRLLDRLRELGLEEDTIVIFMTDNGTSMGYNPQTGAGYNAGMRGFKGSEYDGGHRVPCFVRWPGKLPGGKDVAPITAHIDLVPTLIDLCGLRRPAKVAFDGTSLRPLLTGKGDWPARTLLVHSQRIDHPEKWRKCAVMTDRWRLVNGKELYDMAADPGQKKDVARDHPEVVAGLRGSYERWWADISGRFDEYCEIPLGSAKANPAQLCCHDWHGERALSLQDYVRQEVVANGFWAVEVTRAGTYEVTLRQQPAASKFPIRAQTARLSVGGVEVRRPVPAGATAVTFAVRLKAGKTRLQTWLTDKGGTSRGAYFVEVRYLGDGVKGASRIDMPLVPKLLFGNALPETLFRPSKGRGAKRSFADTPFPNRSLGTRGEGASRIDIPLTAAKWLSGGPDRRFCVSDHVVPVLFSLRGLPPARAAGAHVPGE